MLLKKHQQDKSYIEHQNLTGDYKNCYKQFTLLSSSEFPQQSLLILYNSPGISHQNNWELSLTLEHSMPISSLAAPGLTLGSGDPEEFQEILIEKHSILVSIVSMVPSSFTLDSGGSIVWLRPLLGQKIQARILPGFSITLL